MRYNNGKRRREYCESNAQT